jgi:tripartite-type tricarboxylate transporter receptor subunit TctC
MVETGTTGLGQIKAGTLRGLALTSRERFALEPDMPTVAETLPDFEVISWLGLAGPAGIPRPIVERFGQEVAAALALPDVRAKLAGLGNLPQPSSPEGMRDYIERDIARWSRVVELKKIERY